MRALIAVTTLWLSACDQGVVAKPKPEVAAAKTPEPEKLAADGPFTARAWAIMSPVLTLRSNN